MLTGASPEYQSVNPGVDVNIDQRFPARIINTAVGMHGCLHCQVDAIELGHVCLPR
jgi:hypothetical protein